MRSRRLVVLDDFFPNLLTGFRVAEYNAYFMHWPQLAVYSTLPAFDECHAQYAQHYPQWASRVQRFAPHDLAGADLAYMNFLNNAAHFLPELAARRVPFVLTLYPGGGFGLDDATSDAKLRAVLTSSLVRALIATAPATVDYLRRFAGQESIPLPPLTEIPGLVVSPLYFEASTDSMASRTYVGAGKDAGDVCFVAEKYMEQGLNKGYPAFVAAARAVAAVEPALRFHVVGSFTPADIELGELARRIRFHGTLTTVQLRDFFSGMDVIVSPNQAFTLHPGNFDGFPTGTCVEASLCGVAVLATDPLAQNRLYADGESIVLIEPDSESVARALIALLRDPVRLRRIAQSGQQVTRANYSPGRQIDARIRVLEHQLERVA